MPVQNYSGRTFVAYIDIAGFKELMKDDKTALECLNQFYQAGYNALQIENTVEGFFVSDCGILFVRTGETQERLEHILAAIKLINKSMLDSDFMLTTSIAYGKFDYQDKLEFEGIDKNPIYGYAYVQAFLDNETGIPRIQPGQCRLVSRDLPNSLVINDHTFSLLRRKVKDTAHYYYYWNVNTQEQIEEFEQEYNDTYKLKFSGMLKALKTNL